MWLRCCSDLPLDVVWGFAEMTTEWELSSLSSLSAPFLCFCKCAWRLLLLGVLRPVIFWAALCGGEAKLHNNLTNMKTEELHEKLTHRYGHLSRVHISSDSSRAILFYLFIWRSSKNAWKAIFTLDIMRGFRVQCFLWDSNFLLVIHQWTLRYILVPRDSN